MSITTAVTKQLEPGYVQVDTVSKSGYKRYFKVPQNRAKHFSGELKKQEKNLGIYSNIAFFASVVAGAVGASFFTKKLDSKIMQFLIQTSSAVGLSTLTVIGMSNYAKTKQEDLFRKYHAKEIFYKA